MAGDSVGYSPSWFTPKRLLVLFCIVNLLNYVDRGAIASNGVNGSLETCTVDGICIPGSGIQGDFNLNNFQDGVLSSAFMVGLLIASPLFASLAKSYDPFRLIGVGLSVWTFATAGCGCSFNFWSIAICRMLVGVGEASFISLAAPFIDDNAPGSQKTAWLAMFYMCIPSGTALGYVYGGLTEALGKQENWRSLNWLKCYCMLMLQVGSYFSWRIAFWGEAFFMLPFAVLGFAMEPLQLKGFDGEIEVLTYEDTTSREQLQNQDTGCAVSAKASRLGRTFQISQFSRFSKDIMTLLHEKVYVVNVLGYICYNFVIGAYSYWGPKAGYNIYRMNNADLLFGGVTILCGVVGTLSGGYILDQMKATISNAFKLLSAATLLGAIFCFAAFCFSSLYVFLLLFAVGELFVFATQAPVNYVCLQSVTPSLRPLSMAISTVSIHIFGDVPSAPLIGTLQDFLQNWRTTALILTSVFFLAAGVWFIGVFLNGVDGYDKDEVSDNEVEVCSEPLLDNTIEQNLEL